MKTLILIATFALSFTTTSAFAYEECRIVNGIERCYNYDNEEQTTCRIVNGVKRCTTTTN